MTLEEEMMCPEGSATAVRDGMEIYVLLDGLIDIQVE
jgi:hypothetical protein